MTDTYHILFFSLADDMLFKQNQWRSQEKNRSGANSDETTKNKIALQSHLAIAKNNSKTVDKQENLSFSVLLQI
jgi:hypothetical protein